MTDVEIVCFDLKLKYKFAYTIFINLIIAGPSVVQSLDGALTQQPNGTIGVVVVPNEGGFTAKCKERSRISIYNIILTNKNNICRDLEFISRKIHFVSCCKHFFISFFCANLATLFVFMYLKYSQENYYFF